MDDRQNEEIMMAQEDVVLTQAIGIFCALHNMDTELVRNMYEEQHESNNPPKPPLWYKEFLIFFYDRLDNKDQ